MIHSSSSEFQIDQICRTLKQGCQSRQSKCLCTVVVSDGQQIIHILVCVKLNTSTQQQDQERTLTGDNESDIITDRRLNWYGRVMRRDEDHILRKVLRMDIPEKRKKGRPKPRWKVTCQ